MSQQMYTRLGPRHKLRLWLPLGLWLRLWLGLRPKYFGLNMAQPHQLSYLVLVLAPVVLVVLLFCYHEANGMFEIRLLQPISQNFTQCLWRKLLQKRCASGLPQLRKGLWNRLLFCKPVYSIVIDRRFGVRICPTHQLISNCSNQFSMMYFTMYMMYP